jgi:hypothetical protein
MQTTGPNGTISVDLREMFAVELSSMEAAGYTITAAIPFGIEQIGERREVGNGFGSNLRIVKLFRCVRFGEYRIEFLDKRPWEENGVRYIVSVICQT